MIFIRILVLVVLVNSKILERKYKSYIIHEQLCKNITKGPHYNDNLLVEHVWRAYYAWNMVLGDNCMELFFKAATNYTKLKFRQDMELFMDTKPNWSKATHVMKIDSEVEVLLIPDFDYPKIGRFVGVPNVHKGDYLGASRGTVSVYKLAVKLLKEGRFLLVGDCINGVVTFLVRREEKHTWTEVNSIISDYKPRLKADGFPACKYNRKRKLRRRP